MSRSRALSLFRGRIAALSLALLTLCAPASALGAPPEGASDRLRMLYASKLSFGPEGDPLVRLGILDGRDAIEFVPQGPARVVIGGPGGASIALKPGTAYVVEAARHLPGAYRHWAIVDQIPVSDRARIERASRVWAERGQPARRFELGGLFAVRGRVFDSRTVLLAVGPSADERAALALSRSLEAKYGVAPGVYTELERHPSATLSLSPRDEAQPVMTILERDVLRVEAEGGAEFAVPDIPKSYSDRTERRTYAGALLFAPGRSGGVVLVNEIGAERALKGTVPAEVYASAPEAALEAQAIAARNTIFSAVGVRNLADPFMLRADVMDQVYGGTGAEHRRTSRAVDRTRGRVIFVGDRIAHAAYSSNAGGYTAPNDEVWDTAPLAHLRGGPDLVGPAAGAWAGGLSDPDKLAAFLKADLDGWARRAPVPSQKMWRWTKRVPIETARAWLKDQGRDPGPIRAVRVAERGRSGRVVRLEVEGERGTEIVERELNVRRLFGGLRSGLFLHQVETDERGQITHLSFRGAGFGHGVGMCQTGAAGMAARGKSATEILTHYYRGTAIRALY